jgi:hypothetical protein
MEITTTDSKHVSRSEKYALVPTKMIAEKFKSRGFELDQYTEVKVRKKDRQGHQKHMVRLSNPAILSSEHDDIKLQLLVINSHDGLSSFKMKLGFYRFVCGNGLIVGETFEEVSFRHKGKELLNEVDEAIEKMIAQGNKLNGVIQKMKTVNLSMELQNKFIEEAAKLRDSKLTATDIKLTVNRPEDSGDSVYLVLNRIQEALVTGGIRYKTQKGKERKMRPLKNINRLVDVNSELFDLAQKYTDMGVAA